MDCRTGGLLALVSRPAFEPGKFIRGLTTEEWERIRTGRHPLLNRALQSRYPPGSVFKSVTALVALEAGVASRSTRLSPCRGSYTLGNRPFGCWKAGGHGQLDLVQGFAQSCDVYFYQIGRLLGFERLTRGARTLGLGRITGIDLEGEEAGWIPDADDYVRLYGYPPGPGVPLNLSIGQGELLLTPLELASFYAALVNGGDLVAPRVVSEVIGLDGRTAWSADETPPARRLEASDSHLALMRELLEEVVEGDRGTARGVRVKGFRLGGKTGTAQNPHGEDHALFVGVGPMDDPRWVVVVVVEEAGHGGTVAAPIARRVLRDLLTSAGKSLASHPGPPAP
jgi:penicillin-binding protein 2